MQKHLLTLLLVTFLSAASGAIDTEEAPPHDVRLVEKKLEQLSNQDTSPLGIKALAIAPTKWKHAETDHFIVHYRRVTEAQKVVREVEYDLWFVAHSLEATKERYAKKSHVYVFQDEKEWVTFRAEADFPRWSASFAMGDDLFLHIGGAGEGFDSQMLGHETTHAVVSRLYPGRHWPRWLNEGFAEYMGGASLAARKGQWTKGLQRDLAWSSLSPAELTAMTDYPTEREAIHRFYQSSEKLIRFLMNEFPKERFPQFVEAILGKTPFDVALVKVYGDQVKDYAAFTKRYEQFSK